jgi:hypothetical protein
VADPQNANTWGPTPPSRPNLGPLPEFLRGTHWRASKTLPFRLWPEVVAKYGPPKTFQEVFPGEVYLEMEFTNMRAGFLMNSYKPLERGTPERESYENELGKALEECFRYSLRAVAHLDTKEEIWVHLGEFWEGFGHMALDSLLPAVGIRDWDLYFPPGFRFEEDERTRTASSAHSAIGWQAGGAASERWFLGGMMTPWMGKRMAFAIIESVQEQLEEIEEYRKSESEQREGV